MASHKTTKILTIAVLIIFIIFMWMSAVMYFAWWNKPQTTNVTNQEITTGVQTNTGN